MDRLFQDIFGSLNIIGRFYVIWQWLTVLISIHKNYELNIDNNMNNFKFPSKKEYNQYKQKFDSVIDNIKQNTQKSISPETILQEHTFGSDIAQI